MKKSVIGHSSFITNGKRILAVTTAAAVAFTSAFIGGSKSALAANSGSAAISKSGVTLFSDVTSEMTSASYWTGLLDDADSVLTTSEEVEEINAGNIAASGTNQIDIASYSKTASGETLKSSAESDIISAYVGESGSPRGYYDADGNLIYDSYYDSDGNELAEEDGYFYEAIANCQSDEDLTEVKYALPVRYTTINTLPSDLVILDDPTDPDFDYEYLSGLRVNEPVVVRAFSKDGEWCYVTSSILSGWVSASDLAICASKDEWLSSWDTEEEETLVVYGGKVYTEDSNASPTTANVALNMGTTLRIVGTEEDLVSNRATYYNYVVLLPTRDDSGNYVGEKALISSADRVSEGYLSPTQENIASVAMSMLGKRYGWGGMLNSDDCSQFVRNVYACFGINLARNTTWQQKTATFGYDVSGYSDEEKEALLDHLPLGTVLFFSGHEMIYLGKADGKYYVISAVSSIMNIQTDTKERVRNIIINTLDAKRANGKTWLECLITYKVPWRYKDYSAANATTDADAGEKVDASGFTATLSSDTYTYDGTAKKPAVTVKDPAGNVISSRYYTVTYDGATSVGSHSVGVEFGWLYNGSLTAQYTIEAAANPAEDGDSAVTAPKVKLKKLKAIKKGIKVSWKKVSGVSGYEIQYSTTKNFKKAVTLTAAKSKKKVKIKGLSSGKKYFVRIRSYIKKDGAYYYSKWSKKKIKV
ncbi:MAG: SH3 domain-containing protein [Eubacterium sp.]|nr:SH3 domain-containing protein [Eubacterium sp.]